MATTPPVSARELRQRAEELFKASESQISEATSPEETKRLCHELRVHQIQLEMQNDELRCAQAGLDASQARYFELYDLAPIGYLTLSEPGLILEANLAAANMLGVARGKLLKQPLGRFVSKEHQDIYYLHRQRHLESSAPQAWEMCLKRPDGSSFWALLQAAAAADGECWITLSDISGRKRVEEKLLGANRLLEEANTLANSLTAQAIMAGAAKSEFLANMSHEIRTPMNGLIGMIRLLLDTRLDDEQRGFAEIVRSSSEVMLSLLNDILDFSKIEAHRLELEILDFDLAQMLEDIVTVSSPWAKEKQITLRHVADPDVPRALRGDPGRLRQILGNLVNNAIKFTMAGEVVIEVAQVAAQPPAAMLRFTVRDTGIGIPGEKVGEIFDKFTQVDASTTRRYGGSGLGLTIAKQLVELMGGEIGIASEVGKGSEFWFTVRLEEPGGSPLPRVGIAHSVAREIADMLDGRGAHILVVDDNVTNRLVALGMLKRMGFSADSVDNGAEAVFALESRPYDLVLMDVEMPVMDGLEATRQIRRMTSGFSKHDVPIIAMTAHAMQVNQEQCLRSGMDDYLSKPISPQALASVLTRWLSGDRTSHSLAPAV